MARVILGSLVSGISGGVGGISFAPGADGTTVRTSPRIPNTLNPLTLASRQAMSSFSARWRSLTQTQRDNWANYGATVILPGSLGDTHFLSGLAAFTRLNLSPISPFADYRADAPTATGQPSIPLLTFDYSGGAVRLTAISPSLSAGDALYIRLFSPRGRSRRSRSTRLAATAKVTSATSLPLTLQASYAAAFASGLSLTACIHWRFVDLNFRPSSRQTSLLNITV